MKERLEAALGRSVSRETLERLALYADMIESEATRQNLVSRGTLGELWERHLIDSAQLARFEPHDGAAWVDIGSGAGLPGIVIACLVNGPVSLIEPRRLRVEFLYRVIERLDLTAMVIAAKAERATGNFDVITARALAPLNETFGLSLHLSTRKTVWVLPRGRNAQTEVANARRSWQGRFHVEPSATNADSGIVVATDVKASGR
ncbi:MAG: 16S rRNA (guanine(527)-N(7))-methyltransferase RsmG [Sphingomicrobium sp.]